MESAVSKNFYLKFSMCLIDQGCLLKGDISGRIDPCLEDESEQRIVDKKWQILCGQCSQVITDDSKGIVVNGTHEHTFTNPHGIIFQIGCFSDASGCISAGQETEQWSWFKGFNWKIVYCAGCSAHLGWVYIRSGKITFYGFILNRLLRLN